LQHEPTHSSQQRRPQASPSPQRVSLLYSVLHACFTRLGFSSSQQRRPQASPSPHYYLIFLSLSLSLTHTHTFTHTHTPAPLSSAALEQFLDLKRAVIEKHTNTHKRRHRGGAGGCCTSSLSSRGGWEGGGSMSVTLSSCARLLGRNALENRL
jgi:hypothetical protein